MGYEFGKQFKIGQAGEWVMSKYHEILYHITKSSMQGERDGYDFIFVNRKSGKKYKVEIKTDQKVQIFGNIIIETVSVDNPFRAGWGVTSQSDIIIFYLWETKEVLYFWTKDIKSNIDKWKRQYGETAVIENKRGYNTIGIKLPYKQAVKVSFARRKGVDPYWMKQNYRLWLSEILED